VLNKQQFNIIIGVFNFHYDLKFIYKANISFYPNVKFHLNGYPNKILGGIEMAKIGIITGSTHESRVNLNVAELVKSIADQRTDAECELVDSKDYNLPRFNESIPPIMSDGNYQTPEAKPWSRKISKFDGFVFVSPEYNKLPLTNK
jgi:hypothetical protein